jgi:hypothetical protein
MYWQIIPKGGFKWEDGTDIPLRSWLDVKGEPNFQYRWTSVHCQKFYKFDIPCNTAAKTFDELMVETEKQLAENKDNATVKREIYHKGVEEVRKFKENCKQNKIFFTGFD